MGDEGAILSTSDRGKTWVLQASITELDLLSVDFSSDGIHGWAVGQGGTILATGDGGANWIRQASGTLQDLQSIHISNDGRRGWVVGDNGTILTTDDGGDTWTARDSGTGYNLAFVHVSSNGTHAWAVGKLGTLVATDDGGRTWTLKFIGRQSDLIGAYIAGNGHSGWLVTKAGTIIGTINGAEGARSWTSIRFIGIRPKAVHVTAGGQRILAVGDEGTILTSDDMWATKTIRLSAAGFDLTAVHGAADNLRGWAVGDNGLASQKWRAPTETGGVLWGEESGLRRSSSARRCA